MQAQMAPASRSCIQALAQNTADGVRLCSLEIPQPPSTQEEIDDEEESPKVLKVDALKVRTSYKLYDRDPFLCSTIFAQCAKKSSQESMTQRQEPTAQSSDLLAGSPLGRRTAVIKRKLALPGTVGLGYMRGAPKHTTTLIPGLERQPS